MNNTAMRYANVRPVPCCETKAFQGRCDFGCDGEGSYTLDKYEPCDRCAGVGAEIEGDDIHAGFGDDPCTRCADSPEGLAGYVRLERVDEDCPHEMGDCSCVGPATVTMEHSRYREILGAGLTYMDIHQDGAPEFVFIDLLKAYRKDERAIARAIHGAGY